MLVKTVLVGVVAGLEQIASRNEIPVTSLSGSEAVCVVVAPVWADVLACFAGFGLTFVSSHFLFKSLCLLESEFVT